MAFKRSRVRFSIAPLIWLGSIATNASDCLSEYRGFESHPSRQFAGIAQQAERIHGKDEVVGSSPTISFYMQAYPSG